MRTRSCRPGEETTQAPVPPSLPLQELSLHAASGPRGLVTMPRADVRVAEGRVPEQPGASHSSSAGSFSARARTTVSDAGCCSAGSEAVTAT